MPAEPRTNSRDIHRTRRRVSALVVAVSLVLSTLAVVVASPASAVAVGDEAQLRLAFADPTETLIELASDIFLVDCVAGSLARDSALHLRIQGNGFAIEQACAGHRIMGSTGTGALTLDDLTLAGGHALVEGGALAVTGDVTVTRSTFESNYAVGSGGAIWSGGTVSVADSTFHMNESSASGGAISALSIVGAGSTFTENTAAAGGALDAIAALDVSDTTLADNEALAADGGAILLGNATATLRRVTVERNQAAEAGGGVGALGPSTLVIEDSTFDLNRADRGGAVALQGGVTVVDSWIWRNRALGSNGGALFVLGVTSIGAGSVLALNEAVGEGGAVWGSPTVVLDGVEVRENQAGSGGGVFSGGQLSVTGSVLQQQLVTGSGGAIYSEGPLAISDTVVTLNRADETGGGIVSLASAEASELTLLGNGAGESGGGWDARGATVIDDSALLDNWAARGGALHASGPIEITGSRVRNNEATSGAGGGILTSGDLVLTASTAVLNRALVSSGGAIATVGNASLLVEDTLFEWNRASRFGGAISSDGTGASTVRRSTFVENEAGERGGAISATSGDIHIEGSAFARNESEVDGGAIASTFDPVGVASSTFVQNTAATYGGAIASWGPVRVVNSTLTRNEAGTVGGGIAAEGELHLVHNTLVDNVAPAGVNIGQPFAGGEVTLFANALVATGGDNCALLGPAPISLGYNHATDATCALTGLGDDEGMLDAELGPLSENGGDTRTMLPADTSPLVDVIPVGDCVPGVPVDQRGVHRPSGDGCDVGAVEVGVLVATGDDGAPDGGPGGPGGPGGGADEPGGPGLPGDDVDGHAGAGAVPDDTDAVVEGASEELADGTLPRTGSGSPIGLAVLALVLMTLGVLVRRLTRWELTGG